MRTFSETKHLPFAAHDLYEIVVDVDRYDEFLPWCVASRVRERRDDGTLIADLSIGYGSLREKFTSHVTADPEALTVATGQQSGPFRHMQSRWSLETDEQGGTRVSFEMEFEFRSILLENLIGAVFEAAARKMISAFETRATQLA